jgi:hypothetical protein
LKSENRESGKAETKNIQHPTSNIEHPIINGAKVYDEKISSHPPGFKIHFGSDRSAAGLIGVLSVMRLRGNFQRDGRCGGLGGEMF